MRRTKDEIGRRIHRLVNRLDKLFRDDARPHAERAAAIDRTMAAIKIESEQLSKRAMSPKKPKGSQRAHRGE